MLVVSGEMDNLTTPQEGAWVAELFPNATRFVARNAGHIDALIHPDGSRRARRSARFLRRN